MPLTDVQIRNHQNTTDRPQKLFDSGGLYLEASIAGGKWWRLKYRFNGKENRISLGVYPTVTLKEARERRDEAKRLLSQGINPSEERKNKKELLSDHYSFESIALEWHAKYTKSEWSQSHSDNILNRLKKNIFPWLGNRPVSQITSPEILKVFKKIETRGHLETLHRTLANCGEIFRYAIAIGKSESDPTYKLHEAFAQPIKKHFPTFTDPEEVKTLLQAIDEYHGTFVIKCALQLAPLFFQRPGELRGAEWSEFNFEKREWQIPIHRMKRTRRDKEANPKEKHIVPLATQAITILEDLFNVTGKGTLVFPSERGNDRPISDAALTSAIRRMGYGKDEMQVHGFRAMARTMLVEQLGCNPEWVERQLSHSVKGPLGAAYNRTTFLPERRKMMQDWADYLDRVKDGTFI